MPVYQIIGRNLGITEVLDYAGTEAEAKELVKYYEAKHGKKSWDIYYKLIEDDE